MERIQFYPKGEDPKGKNYIFFAAHPADKERYLDTLHSEILLAEENCVFWLDTQPECPWDDMVETDLARMQVFLFPVTKAMLEQKDPAVLQWLDFASRQNIPVLPILMEPGLDSDYAQVFGDRQYLDKVTVDPTAISYQKKLARFVQDHLVSKEMAEKIRQAFDAYIFLSYRKKDRALAAKLMQLIHQIPQMRDVAIWYDEFLVPGEDFNDNIAAALTKSDVFTMAVTPNLVGEDNYVLSTEYPEAIKAKKPVVAAQVDDTDDALYHKKLTEAASQAQVPCAIDAYNAPALQEALLGKLKHIVLAQNNDPMHNYLIGLAYLNGIDVELDRKSAVKLITDAAEHDCLEAMEKLAQIYCGGNGAKPDFAASMYWQQRAVDHLRQHGSSAEDKLHLSDLLNDLAMSHTNLFQWDVAKDLLTEALRIYEDYRQHPQLGEYATQRYYCVLGTMGTVAYAGEDAAGIKETANRIISELSDQYGEAREITFAPILTQAHLHMAQILDQEATYDELEDRYLLATDIVDGFPEYESSLAGKIMMMNIQEEFGAFYMRYQKYDSAQQCLNRACRLLEQILDQKITADYIGNIVSVNHEMGKLLTHQKDYANAEKRLRHALLCAQRFEQATTMIFFKRSQALIYDSLARMYGTRHDRGDKKEEARHYALAAQLFDQVWESTHSKTAGQDAAKAYQVLGACYQKQGQSAKATQSFHKAKKLLADIK